MKIDITDAEYLLLSRALKTAINHAKSRASTFKQGSSKNEQLDYAVQLQRLDDDLLLQVLNAVPTEG
jgi:hypothetical protein